MASKKINPTQMAQLAAIKAGKQRPAQTTPPTTPPNTDDEWLDSLWGTTTTTTTTVPGTTTTTVPSGQIPAPRGQKSTEPLSTTLDNRISSLEAQLFAKKTPAEIVKVKTGESKSQPWWKKAISLAVDNPVTQTSIIAPLKTLAFVGRVGVSTFEETAQFARENIPGGKGASVYERGDYIPVHKQTGKPIAKAGDPIVRNWEEIINTPISDAEIEASNLARTPAQQDAILTNATKNIVSSKKRSAGGSWSEWARQIGTPFEFKDYGFGDIAETQIGRQLVEAGKVSPTVGKWIDRGTGFVGDVGLDPTTYLSMGTTTAAKTGAKVLGGATDRIIGEVAENIVEVGIKQATKDAAIKVATETGEKVGTKATQQTARAVVAEAAKIAEQDLIVKGATEAARKEAARIARDAARRWSAIAPRREVGAGARQATANEVSQLRDEALQVINEVAPIAGETAEVLAARNFVNAITDDVIRDIAVRGNAAIRGPVAQVLSTPGGLRWGFGKLKVSIPGTETLMAPISKGFTLPRQALAATELGRKAIGVTTRIGEGGLFGSEYIYNWRTGLRSGFNAQTGAKLTGKEAVEALKRLAEDQTYRALKKTTSQTVKVAVDSIFRQKEFKPYFRTVHELLKDETIDWVGTAEEIALRIGRPVQEVELALRIRDIRDEFGNILSELSFPLGGDEVKFPDNWFPEALNDKTVIWLSKDTPIVRDTLRALGLDTAPVSGASIGQPLEEGIKFFGRRLTADDIAGGITRFNQIAREGGFKGEFFDTHAGSAVEKWARKFSDDYAFLRNANRGDLEALGGGASGARTFAPSVYTPGLLGELQADDYGKLAADILNDALETVDDEAVINLAQKLGASVDETLELAQELKKDLDGGVDWLYNDDGTLNLEGFAERFDYQLSKVRLGQLVDGGFLPEARAVVAARQAEILRTPKTVRNESLLQDEAYVLSQLSSILDEVNEAMLYGGMGSTQFYTGLSDNLGEEMDGLRALFAQRPEDFIKIIDNISPRMLDSMVNMTEDAFIKLDNKVIPNIYAQRELAQIYSNVRKLKDPKFQNSFIRFLRNYNRFIKTWVTNTFGFHLRNTIGNAWQMVAGGANLNYLEEGRKIMSEWNTFVNRQTGTIKDIEGITKSLINLPIADATADNAVIKKIAKRLGVKTDDVLVMKDTIDDLITNRGMPPSDWRFFADFARIETRLQDPELLIDTFLTEVTKAPEAVQRAFRDSMMWTGAAGFGDVEEVFGAAIPSRLGITGAEVPVRTGPIGRTASKVSETIGGLPVVGPRSSRSFGAKIENYSRFMFTYDGIRQGLTPEQAAARTARYLVDYEDLTKLDDVAKLIFPFWTWMSRNLPVQTANMFMNPKAYSIYQNFRENFEDKDGNNALLPDYLKKAGLFKAPFGKNIYIKPDLGFPGAGSPSPLQSGVTDLRSLLSSIPAYSLGSAITGTEAFSGAPLQGAGEVVPEIAQQALPPLGVAGRYISSIPGIGAGSDWGPFGPIQGLLGVRGPRESGATAQQRRALASLLGIPLQNIGPDQENAARYEIIRRLQEELNAINSGMP
jgi:hypothetical protein